MLIGASRYAAPVRLLSRIPNKVTVGWLMLGGWITYPFLMLEEIHGWLLSSAVGGKLPVTPCFHVAHLISTGAVGATDLPLTTTLMGPLLVISSSLSKNSYTSL